MIEGKELRDDAAHRMSAHHRFRNIEVIEQRSSIFRKHFDRIFLEVFARFAGAAIVEKNHLVVAGKFPDLMKFPRLVVAARDAAEKKCRSFPMNFKINFTV